MVGQELGRHRVEDGRPERGHVGQDQPLPGALARDARALADLGAAVTPYASIGRDELGTLLLSKLDVQGFRAPHLDVSARSTTSYSLVIERPGIDRTFWHHTGANEHFDGTSVRLEGHDLLHVGYPTLLPAILTEGGRPLHTLLARARGAGITTSLDLAVVDRSSPVGSLDWHAILALAFSECDIVSPSLDDLTSALHIDEPYSPELVDRLADRMLDQGVAVVAISAGRHGLHLRTGSARRLRAGGAILAALADTWADHSVTTLPLWVEHPVTTNGAGDASTAGLLLAISRGAMPTAATTLAAVSAAVVIGGGRPTPAAVTALEPALASLFAA